MYVVYQPKRTILSIISIETDDLQGPLQQSTLDGLDKLAEFSDIIFLFPSGAQKYVDCEKFTSLCSGCSWTIGEWEDTFIESLQYGLEIFGKHYSYLLMNLVDIDGLYIPKDNIINLNMSASKVPILEIQRKSPEELYDYYKYIREIPERSWWEIWRKETIYKWDLNNFYSLWKTDSVFIYMRPKNVEQILEKKEIVSTFESYRDFIASCIMNMGMEYINQNIEDIDYEAERAKF